MLSERLNDDSASEALRSWPEISHDRFWAVRRAAILAELGRTEEALNVAESALSGIRNGLVDDFEHIASLSREGFAMYLLSALRANDLHRRGIWNPAAEFAERAETRRRYSSLQRYGCSPTDVLGWFEDQLDRPVPRTNPPVELVPGFQPTTYSHTIHLGGAGIFEKLLPAYQYVRFIEEAALPPRIGLMSIGMTEAIRVGEWFSEHDGVRAQGLMCRLQEEKLGEGYLTRHRVAALPHEMVAKLKTVADRAAQQTLPTVSTSVPPEDDLQRRAKQRMTMALDMLSRVWVREPEEGVDALWSFACSMYRHPVLRAGMSTDKLIRNLFDSLVLCTPPQAISQQLPTLFQLPIPGEGDFRVAMPERWPDPSLIAVDSPGMRVVDGGARVWRDVKKRLLQLVKSNDAHIRQSALDRLMVLDSLDVLTNEDRVRLGKAFWASARREAALPFGRWGHVTVWYAARLPAPHGLDPKERIRQHLLNIRLGSVHDGMVRPEASLELILFVTRQAMSGAQYAGFRHYVDWTPADVDALFATIRAWWNAHGRELVNQSEAFRFFQRLSGGSTSRFLSTLWDVMRSVILPRMRRSRTSIETVAAFIDDVASAGLPVGSVVPATLFLKPDTVEGVASRLRNEFINTRSEFCLSALRGVVFWVHMHGRRRRGRAVQLPEMPVDLLREVGSAVALRREGLLEVSLDCAFHVLPRLGTDVDGQFARSLIVGLEYLLSEARYRLSDDGEFPISYGAIPRVRRLAVRLAKRLSINGYSSDRVIRQWHEAAIADPLPEVRRIVVAEDSN